MSWLRAVLSSGAREAATASRRGCGISSIAIARRAERQSWASQLNTWVARSRNGSENANRRSLPPWHSCTCQARTSGFTAPLRDCSRVKNAAAAAARSSVTTRRGSSEPRATVCSVAKSGKSTLPLDTRTPTRSPMRYDRDAVTPASRHHRDGPLRPSVDSCAWRSTPPIRRWPDGHA